MDKDRTIKKTEKDQEQKHTEEEMIFGRNAVLEALKSGRGIECLYTLQPPYTGSLAQIVSKARADKIMVKEVSRSRLGEMCDHANHQGVVAMVQAYDYADLEDCFELAKQKGEAPFLVLCESIQDPHNLGAILRSAEAAGVHGVLIPRRNGVGLTAAVAKTAAGALEYVPVVKVGNMARTIDELKERGVWIAAADMDGSSVYDTNLTGSIGLVIGGEHEGISRLTKEKCDYVVSLPMKGHVNSLNASVAAGVLIYEIIRQRSKKI